MRFPLLRVAHPSLAERFRSGPIRVWSAFGKSGKNGLLCDQDVIFTTKRL